MSSSTSLLQGHRRSASNEEHADPVLESGRSEGIVTTVLWVLVVVGSGYLVYRYYGQFTARTPTSLSTPGRDFFGFVHAARLVAAGHSPYEAKGYFGGFYVYTPLVAIALAPFAHAAMASIWHVWVALSLMALVAFGVLVTASEAPRLRSWRLPLLLGITTFTALHFVQTWVEVFANGNTDCFALVILAVAVLVSERGRAASGGVLIGIVGVLKTWPAAVGLMVFRRGYAGRRRALVGMVAALVLGPVLTLAFGGTSGLTAFVRASVAARTQPVLSYSVFATPYQLFARSGLARPLIISGGLRDGTTLLFAAWVIGLLVLTLRWSDSTVLAFWNVMACVVLLVPVSHNDYTLYLLPILWVWAARWLAAPKVKDVTFVICGLLVAWWVVANSKWFTGSVHESALQVAVLFFANLAAVTVSVLGDHLVRVRSERTPVSPGSGRGDELDDIYAHLEDVALISNAEW